ncbi:MAG: ATP synthase A1 subunit C [archaeon]|nr:ATP synthase A1 subunit C [archaeon]
MPENSKIGLGTYPYVNTRVRVMKSFMIKRHEYDKLMKMSPDGITKFMGESVYKKEIDELAMKFSGADLIEAALNLNAARSFNKLIRISSDKVEMLIRAYLVRYDLYNLKTILRGKIAGMSDDDIRKVLVPAGRLDSAALEMLLKKETCREIVIASKVVTGKEVLDAIDECEKTKCLCSVENLLDKSYYNSLMDLSLKMPKQGRYVRQFIKTEIDFLNLKVLFRLVREKLPKEDIVDKLVFSGEKLSHKKLLMLADAKDCEELYLGLSGTGYDAVLEKAMDDLRNKNELGACEIAFEKHWLRQADLMVHQHPLSIGPILGYMIGKDIEVRNLRMLVRAKVTGLDEKFMSESIVV